MLANKLYKVLPSIIHTDQSGFLKGRQLGENLMDLMAVIEQSEDQKEENIIVSLDFEKAFDSVKWESLYRYLKFFNFGDRFIHKVKMLYTNLQSCTINNGHVSKWMDIKRALRQGCCFSLPVFLIVIEVLGLMICQNNDIEGIKIKDFHEKQAQFADDLWAVLKAQEKNLRNFMYTVETFCRDSGLRVNYNKTQILRIGNLKNSEAKLYTQKPISWSKRVKILGLEFTASKEDTVKINYETLLDKITKVFDSWQNRTLTLLGKIQVVNSLVIPLMVHYFTSLYDPPVDFIQKYKTKLNEFLWMGRGMRIGYNKLIKKYNKGGLKPVDMEAKNKSLKCKWIQMSTESKAFWAKYANTVLPMPIEQIQNCNIVRKHAEKIEGKSIWFDVWKAWESFKNKENDTIINPEQEIIWFNSNITILGHPIFYEDYYKKGILYVRDLIDGNTKSFYDTKSLETSMAIVIL